VCGTLKSIKTLLPHNSQFIVCNNSFTERHATKTVEKTLLNVQYVFFSLFAVESTNISISYACDLGGGESVQQTEKCPASLVWVDSCQIQNSGISSVPRSDWQSGGNCCDVMYRVETGKLQGLCSSYVTWRGVHWKCPELLQTGGGNVEAKGHL
jgi:hypothetical protein